MENKLDEVLTKEELKKVEIDRQKREIIKNENRFKIPTFIRKAKFKKYDT